MGWGSLLSLLTLTTPRSRLALRSGAAALLGALALMGLAAIASVADLEPDALRFLPLQSRRASWVTLIAAPDARVVGHLPLEGFF